MTVHGQRTALLPLPPGSNRETAYGRGEGKGKNRTKTKKARALRRNATPAEQKLWLAFRGKTLGDAKFRRQFPCGPYILDFACVAARIAVEVDGESHFIGDGQARDAARDDWLRQESKRVLRFTNPEVLINLDGVLNTIGTALLGLPHPNPLPQGKGAA